MTKAEQVQMADLKAKVESQKNEVEWLRLMVATATNQWVVEGLVAVLLKDANKGVEQEAKAILFSNVNLVRERCGLPYLNQVDFEVPV